MNNYEKLKPCRFVLSEKDKDYGVCRRRECTYAHSIEELRIFECKFNENCYKEDCKFFHAFETKEEYFERVGGKPDLPLKNGQIKRVVNAVKETKVELNDFPSLSTGPVAKPVPLLKSVPIPTVSEEPKPVCRQKSKMEVRVPLEALESTLKKLSAIEGVEIIITLE
jgi:hypothetical protein